MKKMKGPSAEDAPPDPLQVAVRRKCVGYWPRSGSIRTSIRLFKMAITMREPGKTGRDGKFNYCSMLGGQEVSVRYLFASEDVSQVSKTMSQAATLLHTEDGLCDQGDAEISMPL